MNTYPYEDIVGDLLDAISLSIGEILSKSKSKADVKNYSNSKIHSNFKFLKLRNKEGKFAHQDQHIAKILRNPVWDTFYTNVNWPPKEASRISASIKSHVISSINSRPNFLVDPEQDPTLLSVPSPFKIACELLTVPKEPASKAYAQYCLRQFLISNTEIFLESSVLGYENIVRERSEIQTRLTTKQLEQPQEKIEELVDRKLKTPILTYFDLSDRLNNILNHRRITRAHPLTENKKNIFVDHMLGIKGVLEPRLKFHLEKIEIERSISKRKQSAKTVFEKLGPPEKEQIEGELRAAVLAFFRSGIRNFLCREPNGNVYYQNSFPNDIKTKSKDLTSLPVKIEMDFSKSFDSLPLLAEFTNEVWGVPLPMRGADLIFSGGLKLAADEGLVIGAAGTPGAGKTSFALGLATAWAPFGTTTLYLTVEEEVQDLRNRQATIQPFHLRNTSLFKDLGAKEWFVPQKISAGTFSETSQTGAISRSDAIKHVFEDIKDAQQRAFVELETADPEIDAQPQVPLLVVLDGAHYLFGSEKKTAKNLKNELADFVDQCREIGAVVMILSSSKDLSNDHLEHLVDVHVHLDHRNTSKVHSKPYRAFTLHKTRHQISRPGTSIFHINNENGFRISPQLSSQVDKKSLLSQRLGVDFADHPEKLRFTVFNKAKKLEHERFIDTFPSSHILVHGRGSTGKASLGLMCLAAPLSRFPVQNADNGDPTEALDRGFNPKILVLSFLYPETYYNELLKGVKSSVLNAYSQFPLKDWYDPDLRVIHCFPGYLQPEDLFSKVMNALDEAELDGTPYSGIMIDGTHNVFLQFPLLEENGALWPMLYSAFRSRDRLQVVTTHTTISIGTDINDDVYKIRQDKPFLIALLQGTDFYLELNEKEVEVSNDPGNKSKKYVLECRSAIAQPVPQLKLIWNKAKKTFSTEKFEAKKTRRNSVRSDSKQSTLEL